MKELPSINLDAIFNKAEEALNKSADKLWQKITNISLKPLSKVDGLDSIVNWTEKVISDSIDGLSKALSASESNK
jgi:hypothetical protein